MAQRSNGKSKKEKLTQQNACDSGTGREVAVETVDFSDAARPKTCLEVDFPIIPVNQIAAVEGNAGKPIYQMSKWWARRRSSVFRSMLLAASMKAPEDESQAAKATWDVYYANLQKRGSLRHIKVADPFMGGGTTLVEGSRLGMQMFGCDLNPVAWFVVKNEMARVDINEVKRLLADIEAEVKPLIMPYYACDGPDGEKGKWFRRIGSKERKKNEVQADYLSGEQTLAAPANEDEWAELPPDFDIFSIPWQERKDYRYEGPEIVYTFWTKHGPCQREGCGHRTPIMSSPVVAVKTLTVDAWQDRECHTCKKKFDLERYPTRMAPDVPFFIAPSEKPFCTMDNKGVFNCPHCGDTKQDAKAFADRHSPELGKPKNKKVQLTLFIHPQWLEGCPKDDNEGREYGGSAGDPVDATIRWNTARTAKLRLLEVRGSLPEQVTCPETQATFFTDQRGGTAPLKTNKKGVVVAQQSTFACQADGSPNDVLESIKASHKTGAIASAAVQGYSAKRSLAGLPFSGRFFTTANGRCLTQYNEALREWEIRKDADLAPFWPREPLFCYKAGNDSKLYIQPDHGFTHWSKMFNPRQLLVHSQLLRAIVTVGKNSHEWSVREYVLGAFQQYLRNQNLYCFWNLQADKLEPLFSNNNYHPKSMAVENNVFAPLGRGNWISCAEGVVESAEWKNEPWEVVAPGSVKGESIAIERSKKALTRDPVLTAEVVQASATDLSAIADASFDLAVTDPPFGSLIHYSDLADFFYVWLRLALQPHYPDIFSSDNTPKALEVISNKGLELKNADRHYQRLLTQSWREVFRILKIGGLLTFTFHHSEDEPWIAVLESLFDAGFYLEATYPIRSDETKGEGEFGSKTVEYDIIHVCRKRMAEPQPISWARLRREIVDDVRHLKRLLEQHRKGGLPAADLDIIRRGKALEHFSRHYGQVFIERDREFGIRDALPAIKQIADEESDSIGGIEAPPANAEPYTRQFFRIFYEAISVPRDQMQKFLRGTGIAPSDFEERGWCSEKRKIFELTPPVELAQKWKGASRKGMARDFDQTMFIVGACFDGSGIRIEDTLNSSNFAPHPATGELVDWLVRHGGSQEIKHAAQRARTIYRNWLADNKGKVEEQMKLFDLETAA